VPAGYWDLRLELAGVPADERLRQRLVVSPGACTPVSEWIGSGTAFGLVANLYGLRSRRDWGVGDLRDLEVLLDFAEESGAAFVATSPLHYLWNRGEDVSPYAPVSRLHRNPLYLDVEAVPEFAGCETARRRLADPEFRSRLEQARQSPRVDYDGVAALKREILEALHRTFVARHPDDRTDRGRAYARYRADQGPALTDFATYLALAEHFSAREGSHWRRWPPGYRDPRSREVRRFREEHGTDVDFHCFVQFELDRQLARCAGARGRRAGLLQDLALGSTAAGADAWMFQDLFAADARMGAPPDEFAPAGQDWGLPPLDPRRLRARAYEYWTRLLRASFAHSRALRIDHAMALARLFWIPSGRPASEGAYVRYPAPDLLGILALESRRHAALVIGEDLGTVPPDFETRLARFGILSWRVLYFEHDREPGGLSFRAAQRYSDRALVTANTHDLPPLLGFVGGRDLDLRRRVGAIESDAALADAMRDRASACDALAGRLQAEGILADGEALPPPPRLCAAVTAFLARTPAPLVGIALDDLAGESEPVNLPGTTPEQFPSWRRRTSLRVEDLSGHPGVRSALSAVAARRLE
jgi:4-alpha-glucanotransferase